MFGMGTPFPHLFFSAMPRLPATYLDISSAQHEIRCLFIDQYSAVSNNFLNLLCSTSKIALPRYSRVSHKKLNGWEFGHWLTVWDAGTLLGQGAVKTLRATKTC